MKKVIKVLICLLMCFSFSGCFSSMYTRNATNEIDKCSNCNKVTNIESLVDNITQTMNSVDAVSGSYELINTKQTFNISFDAITKDKKINWDLYAVANFDDKEVTLYFKDTKFYIIYPNNGANVILKDKITNLVDEAKDTLDMLNATYDKENLSDIMTGDKLAGFNLDKIRENATYVANENGTYTIFHEEDSLQWQLDVSSNYLISEIRCNAINFTSILKFSYPKTLSIDYPMGLDFLTLNIDEVKEILEVDNFAQVIDESLKN